MANISHESKRWDWFCTETPPYDIENDRAQLNECTVNICSCVLHFLFTIVSCVVLLWTRTCCVFHKASTSKYLIRWPGHMYRWILVSMLLICALAALGEGLLTEMVRGSGDTQLQFYLPSVFLFLATIASLVYYQLIERWRTPDLCWLLAMYWLGCIGVNAARITLLVQTADLDTAGLWLAGLMLLLYLFAMMLEVNLITLKVCKIRGTQPINNREETYEDMRYTEHYVSFLYNVTFWWMNWLFRLGFSRPLELDDLGTLPDNHRAQRLYQIFKEDFQKELDTKALIGQKPSVWKVFGRVYMDIMISAGITRLIYECCSLLGPLTLDGVILYCIMYGEPDKEFVEHQYVTVKEFFANGYILVAIMAISNSISYLCYQQSNYLSNVTGVHIRTSLQTLVYDKSLRLSSYAVSGGSMTVGQITNHMSTDALNLFFFSQKMHFLWAIPFKVIAVFLLLYMQLELTAFLPFATIILVVVPALFIATHITAKAQTNIMDHSDERLKRSNEMLLGMKLLKQYGWEEMFCSFVEAVRKLEMSAIFTYNACYAYVLVIISSAPGLMSLVAFVSYTYISGKALTPDVTFTTLAIMNLLLEPLYYLPNVASLLVSAAVSMSRLQTFFLAPETETSHEIKPTENYLFDKKKKHTPQVPNGRHSDEKSSLLRNNFHATEYESVFSQTKQVTSRILMRSGDSYAVKVDNGTFIWDTDSSEPNLEDINLEIRHGEVTMIVGSVGSGKSSLLSAIIGEMTTLRGSVSFGVQPDGKDTISSTGIAYGAQKAWLMNTTLRDNILFGQPYNQGRYTKVIEASALQPDIDTLPAGDMTEIGEKGINLSGGQKQRISVARAMYSNKSLVLLDDPLSALDVNVGGHVFRNGIMGKLRKEKRTVVLVTHQLQYLQQADKIIVMKKGSISFQGTFHDIARKDPELYKRWQNDVIAATDSELSSGEESTQEERVILRKRMFMMKSRDVVGNSMTDITGKMEEQHETDQLIEKEELARGSVPFDVYLYYFRHMGLWGFSLLFGNIFKEIVGVSRDFWLSDWSEAGLTNQTMEEINTEFVGPYVGFNVAFIVVVFLIKICMVYAIWHAAASIFLHMLRNVARAPLRFFDTTPIGRILNRFASDTQIIDTKLMVTVPALSHYLWSLTFALIVNVIVTPIFLAEIIPVLIIYFSISMYFIRSSRELQRLDSVTRSPVFAHFSETLGGLTTIRAYRDQKRFFANCLKHIETNNKVFLYLQASYGWVGLQMSLCGGVIILMVGITTVLQATLLGSLESSLVGLSLSYILSAVIRLFFLVSEASNTEMQMNPVERAKYYAMVPTEDYSGSEPPSEWPSKGEISLDRVSVRYADSLPSVINDVSLYVRPGEKVGICGRTGSGKSSLTLALLRIIQTFEGSIVIDGEDIARLPLTTLRQRLSIIPQDPILFTGTIRSNLDPQGTKSDDDLWSALEIAQLKQVVSGLSLGLGTTVSEGGENFSVGQRQLFCLARAFLRNSRVLIMDEATASIDYDTEKLLQEVVASAFKDKTVLTIAHRVSTIRDSDTIWVLRDGEVIECDSPENLLARKDSEYYSMVLANK